jgi:hypothetical protein
MKKFLVVLVAVFTLAQAQPELEAVNVLQDFSNLLRDACDQLGVVGGVLGEIPLGLEVPEELTWLCATVPAIDRAANLAEGFLSDVNGFVIQAMNDSFSALGDALGWQVGGADIQGVIDDAMTGLQDGVFSAKGLAGQVLSQLNQDLYGSLATPEPGATESENRVTTALSQTPSHIMQAMQGVSVREDNVMRSAASVDTVNQAKTLAATSVARGDEQQLLLRVTNPAHAIGGEGGTADEAEDLGFAAVSSRAALQAQVQAQADYMRQDAVSSANITAALKEQAMQQTLTTQQVGLLVQSISEQNMREYEQWEADYYDQVVKVMAKGKEIEENFGAVANFMSDEVPE